MKILKVYNPTGMDAKRNVDGNDIIIPSKDSIELAEVTALVLQKFFGFLELSELEPKKVKATKFGKAKVKGKK